jgi:hypothetical protein
LIPSEIAPTSLLSDAGTAVAVLHGVRGTDNLEGLKLGFPGFPGLKEY